MRLLAFSAAALAVLIGVRHGEARTPAAIGAAALVPPAVFAALLLGLDRRRPRLWFPALAALGWGATVAALGALAFNDAALRQLPSEWVTAVVGPLAEEIAKGSALALVILAWPEALRGVRDGIIYGALAGLGFAATENLGYYTLAAVQGGAPGLARALYLRGVLQGLDHAAFTAIIGAAVGRIRSSPPPRAPWRIAAVGFAVAVAVHAVWNTLASPAITTLLCNAPRSDGACAAEPRPFDLLFSVPMLVAAFMGPVAAVLVFLARRDRS